jgi:hypothetical protein
MIAQGASKDGYEGVVDSRWLIAKAKIFAWLSAREHFAAIGIDAFGESVSWLGRGRLRDRFERGFAPRHAERQAVILRLIVE